MQKPDHKHRVCDYWEYSFKNQTIKIMKLSDSLIIFSAGIVILPFAGIYFLYRSIIIGALIKQMCPSLYDKIVRMEERRKEKEEEKYSGWEYQPCFN